MRSNRPRRSDRDLLEDAHALGMLRAVASGLVVRGGGGDRGVTAAYLLDGEQVRLSMVWLAREDLILMPISGPPRVAPRGRRLLEIANGEIARQSDSGERHRQSRPCFFKYCSHAAKHSSARAMASRLLLTERARHRELRSLPSCATDDGRAAASSNTDRGRGRLWHDAVVAPLSNADSTDASH